MPKQCIWLHMLSTPVHAGAHSQGCTPSSACLRKACPRAPHAGSLANTSAGQPQDQEQACPAPHAALGAPPACHAHSAKLHAMPDATPAVTAQHSFWDACWAPWEQRRQQRSMRRAHAAQTSHIYAAQNRIRSLFLLAPAPKHAALMRQTLACSFSPAERGREPLWTKTMQAKATYQQRPHHVCELMRATPHSPAAWVATSRELAAAMFFASGVHHILLQTPTR